MMIKIENDMVKPNKVCKVSHLPRCPHTGVRKESSNISSQKEVFALQSSNARWCRLSLFALLTAFSRAML